MVSHGVSLMAAMGGPKVSGAAVASAADRHCTKWEARRPSGDVAVAGEPEAWMVRCCVDAQACAHNWLRAVCGGRKATAGNTAAGGGGTWRRQQQRRRTDGAWVCAASGRAIGLVSVYVGRWSSGALSRRYQHRVAGRQQGAAAHAKRRRLPVEGRKTSRLDTWVLTVGPVTRGY